MLKLGKKHLHLVLDEARRNFIDLPGGVYLESDNALGLNKILSEQERLAYCYLKACLLMLNSVGVLSQDWESKIDTQTHNHNEKIS